MVASESEYGCFKKLIPGGALNTFLKENAGKVEVKEKLDMCLGAALGVEYLHLNQCMHRDLAARNCLITNDKVVRYKRYGVMVYEIFADGAEPWDGQTNAEVKLAV
ncbi:hypothetical protein ANCDUO_02186, partial [Ancylostoma duodenale]